MIARFAVLVCAVSLAACSDTTAPAVERDCLLAQSASQPIATSHQTALAFDASTCSFPITGDRVVLPAGRWLVQAQLTWSPNVNGQRGMCIIVNGTVVPAEAGAPAMQNGIVTIQSLTTVLAANGSDYVQITGTQTSGSQLKAARTWGTSSVVLTFMHVTRLD